MVEATIPRHDQAQVTQIYPHVTMNPQQRGALIGRPAATGDEPLNAEGKTEKGFRTLFENAPDAIFVESLEGRVLDVNPAACDLHRLAREQLVGLHVSDLVPPDLREPAMVNFRSLAAGEVDHVEGFSYTSDGEAIPVSVRARRIDYRGREALLFHVSDLSERRSLEEQLLRSQKMEAIGRLAGGVAHDFNNLLTTILGYTELCLASVGKTHESHSDLIEIQRAGEQAAKLTRQLLAFSRQQVLTPRIQNLNEVVAQIEHLCQRAIGEDVLLDTRLGSGLLPVKIDESQFEQVLLNLAVNSRDALPKGGEILIETSNVHLETESVRDEVAVPGGDYVCLEFIDNGTGMTPEVKSRVFDPFFTTKDPDRGTGLGLSTVYGIVKQSGGFIWVDSELGQGTRVRILLPAAARPASEPGAEGPTATAAGRTILLTEDNPSVRELTRRVLEDSGFSVISVDSGEEALRICAGRTEPIDLLLTDLVLSGMDGVSLAEKVLSSRQETRVLLMSGHSKKARFNPEALLEGTSFLQKPFTRAGLERAVRRALSEQTSA